MPPGCCRDANIKNKLRCKIKLWKLLPVHSEAAVASLAFFFFFFHTKTLAVSTWEFKNKIQLLFYLGNNWNLKSPVIFLLWYF